MLRTDFGEKCIIMHFLGWEKDEKSSQRRGRRDAEKRFEEDRRREKRQAARSPAYLKAWSRKSVSAKSFICTHIDQRITVSGLFAYTSQNRGGGGTSFFENGLWEVRVGDG